MDKWNGTKGLTVRREVHVALDGQEGVALALLLVLGRELLGRHLNILHLANLVLACCCDVVAHFQFCKSIIESRLAIMEIALDGSDYRIIR